MKRCIISFANEKNLYVKRLARLSESLRTNFDGDFLGFVGEASCGAEPHLVNPYNFKIHCIQKAIEAGYSSILWLDSSCFAIKNVNPVFEIIEEKGFLFQDAGHWLGEWTNDKVLAYFDLSRDEAMEMRMIGNAGFLGLDFSRSQPNHFFQQWRQSMYDGCFQGRWNNNDLTESQDERCRGSRHDMSCSSAIVHRMGLFDLAVPGDQVLQYGGPFDETLNETIIIKAQG